MQNISRDAHIPHANGMRARAAAAVFVGHLFQNADRTRSFSSPYVPNPLGSRNTSPAAYDATLLQKEMLSRSYLCLALSLCVLELKAFCCRVPKPKDSFPPRRRRRRWRREMTPPPAKYSLISASIFRASEGGKVRLRRASGVTAWNELRSGGGRMANPTPPTRRATAANGRATLQPTPSPSR